MGLGSEDHWPSRGQLRFQPAVDASRKILLLAKQVRPTKWYFYWSYDMHFVIFFFYIIITHYICYICFTFCCYVDSFKYITLYML